MTCFGGEITRMGPSQSSLFITRSQGPLELLSQLELFGRLGFQLGLASLVGRRLGAGCSPLTAWRDLDGASPTYAICVKIRRKPHIIFFCFVRRPEYYDFWSSPFLGCNGWCTPLWEGTSWDGMVPLWARKGRKLGELPPFAWCPFRKKGIGEPSMMLRGMTKKLNPFFLYTFVNWAGVYIEEHTLSLIDFVDWLATK